MTSPSNPPPDSAKPRISLPVRVTLVVGGTIFIGFLAYAIDHCLKYPPHRMRCAANLIEIGKALKAYADDNEGLYPPSPFELFPRWCTQECLFQCPCIDYPMVRRAEQQRDWREDVKEHLSRCYRYVSYPTNTAKAVLAGLPIVFDKSTNHPSMNVNMLFGDGHVEWEKRPGFIAKLRSMAHNETLSNGCRDVLKQTLKTVEEEDGK